MLEQVFWELYESVTVHRLLLEKCCLKVEMQMLYKKWVVINAH